MSTPEWGVELWIGLGIYCFLLLGLLLFVTIQRCWRQEGQGESHLVEHFLAGREMGPITLGFSICASMFSGATCVALPAEAYSKGFSAWRWVGSCTIISLTYIAYAPRMQWLSRVRGHDSLLSFVRDRYGAPEQWKDPLHWLLVLVLLLPCFIYLCVQFDAFGNTISSASGGVISPLVGASILAGVVTVYEILGGLRAVAMTDVIQGAVLVTGSIFVLFFMDATFGGLPALTSALEKQDPGHVQVLDSPDWLDWVGFCLGIGIMRALFPDYPQRAMAAGSQNNLRVANVILAIAPFLVQVPMLYIGIIGRVSFPDLENPKSVFNKVVLQIVVWNGFGKFMGTSIMVACVAAIMSTADSVLITISQIITLDVIRPIQDGLRKRPRKDAQQVADKSNDEADKTQEVKELSGAQKEADMSKSLTMVSRAVSLVVAGLCIPIVLSDFDLSFLMKFQSSILMQTLPTFVFALYWRGMHRWSSISGLVVGVSVGMSLVGTKVKGGILISIACNLVVTFAIAFAFPRLADPVNEAHAEALKHIFWRQPTSDEFHGRFGADSKLVSTAPPPAKEPIKTMWGLMVLAAVLPWFALPFYRSDLGKLDSVYLGGTPLWAVCSLLVLLFVHLLLVYIIGTCWEDHLRNRGLCKIDGPNYSSNLRGKEIISSKVTYVVREIA